MKPVKDQEGAEVAVEATGPHMNGLDCWPGDCGKPGTFLQSVQTDCGKIGTDGFVMILFVLSMMLAAPPPQAEWRRQGYSGKGPWTDTQQPHSLLYFTQDPFLRDDSNDFCIACTPEEKATIHFKMTARTEVHSVGVLAGFTIFDVFYYFESKEVPDWKFVLVQTGRDRYREIIHVQRTQFDQDIGPTSIVKAGQEELLKARGSAGGNKGVEYGDYFWLGKDGPVLVEIREPVMRAGAPLVPQGKSIYGEVGVDFPRLTATLSLMDQKMWGCCSGDSIVVKFSLDRGKVTVTDARYVAVPR